MKFSKYLCAAIAAAACFGATAQEAENMYLIKSDRVVGKYAVDDVDYVSFRLPDGVVEEPIWITVDNTGKNTVTYTVNTLEQYANYAHGILSYYDVNYMSMDMYGDNFEYLTEEQQIYILQGTLPYSAYLGIGTNTYTQTDWRSDGLGHRFQVMPNTRYFICAWEVDPVTQAPLDTFVYTETTTLAPGQSSGTLDVTFKRQNEEGLAYNITANDDILYIMTAFGKKYIMDMYVQAYGADFLFGTFGQIFTLDAMQGSSDINPNIEAATWPADESGEYILMVRGYDADGNMVETSAVGTYEAPTSPGPQINIISKSKGQGKVSVNFEITPSNVSEAYVRMLEENEVDNKLNDGWYLYEIASSGDCIDIENAIHNFGEYTFTRDNLPEKWYSILIYARDKDGARTIQRINFNVFEESEWSIPKPSHIAPLRAKARMMAKSHRPTFDRVK